MRGGAYQYIPPGYAEATKAWKNIADNSEESLNDNNRITQRDTFLSLIAPSSDQPMASRSLVDPGFQLAETFLSNDKWDTGKAVNTYKQTHVYLSRRDDGTGPTRAEIVRLIGEIDA
jgi:hypothetical protein